LVRDLVGETPDPPGLPPSHPWTFPEFLGKRQKIGITGAPGDPGRL
jgi:hypothetical protein